MKKKEIKKELKYHKKWLKSILRVTDLSQDSRERIEIEAEIDMIKWVLKKFKK